MVIPSFFDSVSRIRNAYMAGNVVAYIRKSNIGLSFLELLKREGYIRDFVTEDPSGRLICVYLRYHNSIPAIRDIRSISKPGCRVYSKIDKLRKFYNGMGIYVLSTSKGLMTCSEARKKRLGGELLCGIF
jgi:small subunit ribosomal protein S8